MTRALRNGLAAFRSELLLFAVAVFVMRFGEGVLGGARANFFSDTLGLSGGHVLWLEGIREVPGLVFVFIAALTMHLPLSRRGGVSIVIEGIGYGLQASVRSFTGLIAVALTASVGLHGYQPVHPSLAMSLAPRDRVGRVMGALSSVAALAGIVGMGAIAVTSSLFERLSLRAYYVAGGVLIVLAGLLLLRLPSNIGDTKAEQPRMLFSRRYWLYYVLTFFEGARKQVLGTFGTLVLVQMYDWKVWQVSTLLVVSGVINLACGPLLGYGIDRFGERKMLTASYALLAVCCVCYATVPDARILAGLWVTIKLLLMLSMAVSTYVNRIAPREELTPTLSAGVSINHISSVVMPLISGAIIPLVGYSGIFLMTGGLVALSVPFALSMRLPPRAVTQPVPAS